MNIRLYEGEDIKRNEELRKNIEFLNEQIIKASMIPKEYFNSNPDEK